jgi:putative flippase GtrA
MERFPGLAALRDAHDLTKMLRFAAVGLVTTGLDFAMFIALGIAKVPPAPANVGSYSCGIALSYVLNRRWTFSKDASLLQAVKFVLATASGLALSTLLLIVLTKMMPPLVAKTATLPIVFLWNYHSTRQWVFRVSAA